MAGGCVPQGKWWLEFDTYLHDELDLVGGRPARPSSAGTWRACRW